MFDDATRVKLQNIVQGTVIEAATDHCTVARNFLCSGFGTSKTVKRDFESQLLIKKEQAIRLSKFATLNNLWIKSLPSESKFLAEGGEAKVFFDSDNLHVIKINDAGYYATWLEYFNSLVLHNLFFSETAYSFLGFVNTNDTLKSVVRQRFIIADGQADLADIRDFLATNGFANTRRQDYYNKEYGLILEDMHDENVLVNSNTLFFIDTVFYTIDPDSEQAVLGTKK
ncbi:MAG TPA: hypothetical protein VFV68_05295 [Agriterribacter sp.]|nr:hypothetical protein [Agriterribacter sp.]